VGLEGREHHASSELSGGQQQRVAIARAIVTSPALVVADEPTRNLDTARKDEIMKLLSELNTTRGICVVMVTHEGDIARWARRIIEFRDGLVIRDTPNSPTEG
jgi:putative ABC transport system ATP-binding protein